MKEIKNIIIFLILILFSSTLFAQETKRWKMTKEQARQIVLKSLSDATYHNAIGTRPILTKKKNVIKFCEGVLWDIYGKKNCQMAHLND